MFEAVIVGAGFVGSLTALELAKRGIDVLLFEEHKKVGEPPHCAGLVGISGLKRINLFDELKKEGLILNYISSARFYTPSGRSFKIDARKPIAVVLDRVTMDKYIAGRALDFGAEIKLLTRVLSISPNGEAKIRGRNSHKETVRANVIIDAEGATRRLLRGFPGVHMRGILPAFQVDIRSFTLPRDFPHDSVEVFFIVPDFFAWIIPLDPIGRAWRVGAASRKNAKKLRKIVINIAKRRFGNFSIEKSFGGLVVSGGPIKRFHWNRIIAVGDSAGQTKPTTGGGVVFGGLGAIIASRVVTGFLDNTISLDAYEKIWNTFMRSNINAMLLLRKTYNTLTHRGMDVLLRFIPKPLISNIRSDFDFQLYALISLLIPMLSSKIAKF